MIDPDNDRSAHKAARGKPKVARAKKAISLAHLSRKPLTQEEFEGALELIRKESDRGAAIMGASLVEDALQSAINSLLVNPVDQKALFHDQGAPFGTFRAKAVAAHALGLCDQEVLREIDTIREIRNQFSHALRPINFRNPDVAAYCEQLRQHGSDELYAIAEPDPGLPRFRYEMACMEAHIVVLRSAQAIGALRSPPSAGALGLLNVKSPGDKDGDNYILGDRTPV